MEFNFEGSHVRSGFALSTNIAGHNIKCAYDQIRGTWCCIFGEGIIVAHVFEFQIDTYIRCGVTVSSADYLPYSVKVGH
jgi:hypothetical protein